MNGEQNALALQFGIHQVQNEGDPYGAGLVIIRNQEVAADMQLAVVFFVKTCGLFNVLVHRVFGDGQAVVLLDPAFFFNGGRFQIHPDGLEAGEFFQGLDLFLEEASVGKGKNIEHGNSGVQMLKVQGEPRWGAVACDHQNKSSRCQPQTTKNGRFPRSFPLK